MQYTVRHTKTRDGETVDTYHQAERVIFHQTEVEQGKFRGGLELFIGDGMVALLSGGKAYVMNEAGKTVGSYTLPDAPMPNQMADPGAPFRRHAAPGSPDDPLRGSDEPHRPSPEAMRRLAQSVPGVNDAQVTATVLDRGEFIVEKGVVTWSRAPNYSPGRRVRFLHDGVWAEQAADREGERQEAAGTLDQAAPRKEWDDEEQSADAGPEQAQETGESQHA